MDTLKVEINGKQYDAPEAHLEWITPTVETNYSGDRFHIPYTVILLCSGVKMDREEAHSFLMRGDSLSSEIAFVWEDRRCIQKGGRVDVVEWSSDDGATVRFERNATEKEIEEALNNQKRKDNAREKERDRILAEIDALPPGEYHGEYCYVNHGSCPFRYDPEQEDDDIGDGGGLRCSRFIEPLSEHVGYPIRCKQCKKEGV